MPRSRAQAKLAVADVLGATDLCALVADRAGRILQATPKMEAMFAKPGESLTSALLDSLFSPRNPQWLALEVKKKAATGSWTGNAVLRMNDGRECWAHIQAHHLPDPDPAHNKFLVIIEDVTEHVELMNTLMQRTKELFERNWELEVVNRIGRLLLANTDLESRLNAVLREAVRCSRSDGGLIFVKDRRTGRLVCRAVCGDSELKSLLGFSFAGDEESLVVLSVKTRSTQVSNDVSKDSRVLKRLAERCGAKVLLSVPIIACDQAFGALVLGRRRFDPFLPENIALVEVITNHAALAVYNAFLGEEAILSRAYWQRTLDAIDDLVAVIDSSGTIVRVNEPLARMLETDAASLVGEDCSKLHPALTPQFIAELSKNTAPVFFGDKEFCGEICEASALPLTDASGKVDAIVLHGKLITDERRLRDEFRRASRLASVGEMLAGTAHSFGNVLMAIKGTLEAARRAKSSEVAEKIEQALAHTTKGTEIVRRLLSFSRGAEEAPRGVSLASAVEAVLDLIRSHPAAKGRVIANLVPSELPEVEARPGPLQEVILNLILNALQSTRHGGEVRIDAGVEEGGEFAYLRVADNGRGIPPADMPRIFEPFFSTKGGTGLGLSTSKAAIHRMGGTIGVESEPGKGAVFTVRLKLLERSASESSKAA